MKVHISNTKLERGEHYYIKTRHKDLFSHYNLLLRKNVRKSARKYKRNVLIPPGLPIILLKSNEFNMAAVSVKRAISTPNSPWRASLFSRRYTIIQASFGSVF